MIKTTLTDSRKQDVNSGHTLLTQPSTSTSFLRGFAAPSQCQGSFGSLSFTKSCLLAKHKHKSFMLLNKWKMQMSFFWRQSSQSYSFFYSGLKWTNMFLLLLVNLLTRELLQRISKRDALMPLKSARRDFLEIDNPTWWTYSHISVF